MSKTAFLFPDVGEQRVGMAIDLAAACPKVADFFQTAAEYSGLDVFELCAQGPDELLSQPQYAHVCVATASYAAALAVCERGVRPAYVAGFGPGEYVAHALAGSIDEEHMVMLAARLGSMLNMAQATYPEGDLTAPNTPEREFAARNMGFAFRGTLFVPPQIPVISASTGVCVCIDKINDELTDSVLGLQSPDRVLSAMFAEGVRHIIVCGPGKRLVEAASNVAHAHGIDVAIDLVTSAYDLDLMQQDA